MAISLFTSELNKLDLYDELETARENNFIDMMDDWVTSFELEEQAQLHKGHLKKTFSKKIQKHHKHKNIKNKKDLISYRN